MYPECMVSFLDQGLRSCHVQTLFREKKYIKYFRVRLLSEATFKSSLAHHTFNAAAILQHSDRGSSGNR